MALRLWVTTALVLSTSLAWAEKATVNLHLDPAVGFPIDRLRLASGVTAKVDTTLFEVLGPVSPQLEVFGVGATTGQFLNGAVFGAGLGARLRLFNDEGGYFFHPNSTQRGNLWGNYWLDAHATYAFSGEGVGFDVATGAEFSVVTGLQVGPFAKFQYDLTQRLLLFGLSFSIGLPIRSAASLDADQDGIADSQDKCVAVPEDRDGFEDGDGCPEADNDNDRVLDAQDRCPNQPGSASNQGCPELDADGDGTNDKLDKCVNVKGLAENAGCPDIDTDSDTVVDRLDKCPQVKGLPEAQGCPPSDQDQDQIADAFDNCPTEAGPASNQGCPLKQKQLVVITKNELKILDKVYFDTGKSSIQRRSYALLNQIAAVLGSHAEIKTLQVEGHTDNKGNSEANKALSSARAEAVRVYLVSRGVEGQRLRAVGFGQEQPEVSNDTPKGREANRRVEFNIVP